MNKKYYKSSFEDEDYSYKNNTKYSYGIALFKNSSPPSILLVQKRCTYEFIDFILGNYGFTKPKLYSLFNYMTFHEKMDIMTGDFRYIWYKAFLEDVCENRKFKELYTNYMTNSFQDSIVDNIYKPYTKINMAKKIGIDRIIKLFEQYIKFISNEYLKNTIIGTSNTAEPTWEIPKGRLDKNETPLTCAVRELEEETNIPPHRYYLYVNQKPIDYTITSNYITYNTKYYFAMIKNDINININYKNTEQVKEICRSKWLTLQEIFNLDNSKSKNFYNICAVAFKKFKKIRNKKVILEGFN